jgi:hypothetical protein
MQSCVGSFEVGKYLERVKSPLLPTINRGRGVQKLIRCFDVANGKINVSFVFLHFQGKQIYYQTLVIENEEAAEALPTPKQTRETLHVKCSILSSRNHSIARRDVLPAGFQEAE